MSTPRLTRSGIRAAVKAAMADVNLVTGNTSDDARLHESLHPADPEVGGQEIVDNSYRLRIDGQNTESAHAGPSLGRAGQALWQWTISIETVVRVMSLDEIEGQADDLEKAIHSALNRRLGPIGTNSGDFAVISISDPIMLTADWFRTDIVCRIRAFRALVD